MHPVDQETRFGIDDQLADRADTSSGGGGGISGGSLAASNEESNTAKGGESQAAPKSTESGEVRLRPPELYKQKS